MAGFHVPNHTQTPNSLFDEYLSAMGYAELKVTLAVVRKTFGWHKEREKISLSQLQQVTGLTRESVSEGIKAGEARGTLKRRRQGDSFMYELVLLDTQPTLDAASRVARLGGRATRPASGRGTEPQGGRATRPTKESAKEKEKEIPSLNGSHEVWSAVRERLRGTVTDYTFHIWLEPLELESFDGTAVMLTAPEHIRSWIADRYVHLIRGAFAAQVGSPVSVEVGAA